jgi:hypothetical protein
MVETEVEYKEVDDWKLEDTTELVAAFEVECGIVDPTLLDGTGVDDTSVLLGDEEKPVLNDDGIGAKEDELCTVDVAEWKELVTLAVVRVERIVVEKNMLEAVLKEKIDEVLDTEERETDDADETP